ncbi:MAG TPA: glycosyltransferase [Phycisphaerae bacterium]|nr:glycosyltransferase [Phycisphaerae bacterium]HRR84732.1 glycosyltransferase [Phycisphaerae bacterium]
MISGKNIICFASGWNFHPTSKHHIMRRLARRNNVVWVNWHASRRPTMHPYDLRMIWDKLRQMRQGAQRVAHNIAVVTPFQVPMPSMRLARRFNRFTVRRAIEQVVETLPNRPVQLWSFAPDVSDFVGCFGEELALYYCVDAFGEFPGYDRALIENRERQLLDRVDVVIATSRPLYESKSRFHRNVHLVEHGVDYEQLSRAVKEELDAPRELESLRRPIIGYIGVVGEWVDLDLLAALAREYRRASIVVIGPVLVPHGPCEDLPNVYWLGERDHVLLPAYLRLFDIGLIPFKHVPLTRSANPIKLYEYLAAGVPVVSTGLPSVRPIPNAVWVADDVERMIRCCEDALACNSAADRRRRSDLMRSESWEARLEQIAAIIDACGRTPPCGRSGGLAEALAEEERCEAAVMTST